jgi:outer membrane protein assembly factor BamB
MSCGRAGTGTVPPISSPKTKRKMLLFCLLSGMWLIAASCSLFRSKNIPYPQGIMFPLEEASRASYEGEILKFVQKEGEKLYFSTKKNIFYCWDGQKREVIWKFATDDKIASPPCLGQQYIFFYDLQNTLYCLARKGQLVWKKKIEAIITSPVSEGEGRIYFGTESGEFLALSSAQGEPVWSFRAGGPIRSEALFWENLVVFGCDDGKFYTLTKYGKLDKAVPVGSKILGPALLEKGKVYFGTDDQFLRCLDVKRGKLKWKLRIGGLLLHPPLVEGNKIYLLSSNSVLFCLHKKGGDILWWHAIPSRIFYGLEFSGENIIVTSLSPLVVGFNKKTGQKAGEYDAGSEVKSNALWQDPFLLINIYDFQKDNGSLVYLKKIVNVFPAASPASPQNVGAEVTLSATSMGLFRPKYEFYIKEGENRTVLQKESDKSSYVWYLEKEGEYVIGVKASDEKGSAESEIAFSVKKPQPNWQKIFSVLPAFIWIFPK